MKFTRKELTQFLLITKLDAVAYELLNLGMDHVIDSWPLTYTRILNNPNCSDSELELAKSFVNDLVSTFIPGKKIVFHQAIKG